jgi:hypothetical protein
MELPGSSYLLNLAVIAITFAGFSTIAFVFRQAQGSGLSKDEILFISTFIQGGLLTTVFPLLPSLLALLGIAPAWIWRLSSFVLLLSHISFIISYRRHRAKSLSSFRRSHVLFASALNGIVDLSLLMNVIGIGIEPNIGFYAIGTTAMLGQIMFLFLTVLPQFLQPLQKD